MSTFYGRTVDDHLHLITNLDRLVTFDILQADAETIRYYVDLAGCLTSTIPGKHFLDIFNAEEVGAYFGESACGCHCHRDDGTDCCGHCRNTEALDYVRTELLPKFSAALLQHFSTVIFTYRNELGGKCGNPPEESKPLPPCPSMQQMIDRGEIPAAPATETPRERFLRAVEELNEIWPSVSAELRREATS